MVLGNSIGFETRRAIVNLQLPWPQEVRSAFSVYAMNYPVSGTKDHHLLSTGRISKTFILFLHATTKGSVLVRILGVSTGLGLVVSSLFIWEEWIEIRKFDVAELLTSVVSIGFGFIGMLMETNTLFDINDLKRHIISFAPSLERVSGRGMMYIVCGLLQMLIRVSIYVLFGACTVAAGSFMVYTGQQAQKKLEVLKKVLTNDESVLVEFFRRHDGDADGKLNKRDFEKLLASMYLEQEDKEIHMAFQSIDEDGDHKITFDEFREWSMRVLSGFQLPNETFYPGEI